MRNYTIGFNRVAHKILWAGLAVILTFGLEVYSSKSVQAQEGVAPTVIPAGGFAVDGNLLSRTPTSPPFSSDDGDFLPNDGAPGTGGYVFTLDGLPVDTATAFHVIDGYDADDSNIFTGGSKLNNDPNTWVWKPGKAPGKDDINNTLFFFSNDTLGNIWFVGSGDRKKTNGNTYLDFELLQNPLYENSDRTFTSLGPDGGRTIGDLLISVTYTIGGSNPELFIYQWDITAQGDYTYNLVSPAAGTAFLATNSNSAIVVPYGAFGTDIYPESAFTEVAVNLNGLIPGSGSCVNIKTVIVKSKASQSINAALKDFISPVQVNIGSAPELSLNSPTICIGDSTTLTATILSGTGPFSYLWSTGDTTESITVSPDTTTQYTLVVTGINGCPSNPVSSTVTVVPLPVCFISGPDSTCPMSIDQFFAPDSLNSYAWTISGNGTILGDTSLQMIEVQGNGSCDSSFTLNLVVTNIGGCSSICSMIIYQLDTISPVITNVPDSLMVSCASEVPPMMSDTVIVTDNCEGNISLVVSDTVFDQACLNQFTILRTWTATDTCGNFSTESQIISVFDSIPPVLDGVPADTGVCCADSIPLPASVTAFDNCDGALPVTLTEVVSDSTSPLYFTLTRIWTAIDTCYNMASDTMVIEVNDTLYPAGGGLLNVSDPEAITLYFTVSPNPISSSANIQFSLHQDAYVSVDLYNYAGVKQKTIYNGDVSAETNIALQLSPDASMRKGMYLLVLRTNYGIETRKVILK